MDGQSKVNADINHELLQITSARGVLTFCEWSSGEFDVTNAVTALHRLASAPDRRPYSKDPRWSSVVGKAHQMTVHACTREDAWPKLTRAYIRQAAWAFSIVVHRDEYLFECLGKELLKPENEPDPHDISSFLRASANLKIKNEDVMDIILMESRMQIHKFRPAHLAGLASSMAVLALKDEDLMENLSWETIDKAHILQPKHIREVAWAAATLGFKKRALSSALCDAAIGKIEDFHPRDLASTAHSFASLSAASEAVMEVIMDKLLMRMHDLDPGSLAKIAEAVATSSFVDKALVSNLVTMVLNRQDDCSPWHLSVISGSFATLDLRDNALVDVMKKAVSLRLDAFQAEDLALMIPAFVRWGARDEVEGDLYMAAMDRMNYFGPKDLAAVVEAYESHGDQELLGQLLKGAACRFSAMPEAVTAAEHWVQLTTLVAAHADEATQNSFEPKFIAAVLRPLLQRLKDVSSPVGRNGRHFEALTALQNFVATTQLKHLGPYYTRHILLGTAMPLLSAGSIEYAELQQVAQADNHVAASWELQWRRNWWVEPCGRLFTDGVPRSGSRFLPPLLDMKAGAGRNVLLHLSGLVMKKCPEEKLQEVIGFVRVVATQFPGIDMLVALCQFRHHFASVRLEVDYIV